MTSDGGNAYIDDISYQRDDSLVLNPERSKIAEWFAHTNVLVTGGTGFLGKLIIEKLLRSCPGITTIYVIVRPKKGKSSEQRFTENFEDAVYDRLRREQPNFLNKVIMVEGDAMQDDYGLSPKTKTMLMNTNIIFHAAATVRFDEKMRLAVNINVKSTKYLLLFAKRMPNLKAFVHVSTAFSNCMHKYIDEKHYRPPIDGDKLISLLDIFDDEQLEKITPILLQNWPNTYIFSKAVAESIVAKYSEGIPTCIVRPSIVVSTAEEPLIGWINNLYGVTGLYIGAALGVLHTLHCIPEKVLETIPADYVVSTTIAAAWGTSNKFINPTDSRGIFLATWGDGWHNYHHVFPWDYRSAELGNHQFSAATTLIDLFAKIGWAYDLKVVPNDIVQKRVQRTGDGSHAVGGWGDADQTQEDRGQAMMHSLKKD